MKLEEKYTSKRLSEKQKSSKWNILFFPASDCRFLISYLKRRKHGLGKNEILSTLSIVHEVDSLKLYDRLWIDNLDFPLFKCLFCSRLPFETSTITFLVRF